MIVGQKWLAAELLRLCLARGDDVAAVSAPRMDDRLAALATAEGIPVCQVPKRLTGEWVPAGVDVLLCANAHVFVTAEARGKARLGALGYHPSLLPRHRGRDAVRCNLTIPRMTAGGTAYWLADESTQITESQATIGQVSLTPHNVAALTEISHQLMQQSSPDAEQMVMNDLAQVLGLAVDVACLRGSGVSGQPHGIVGTSGVGSFDTDSTNTFSDVLDAQVDVSAANALRPGCAYVADFASAALLMGRSRFSSTDTPIWNGSLLEGTMAGFPCRASNQMSANTMLFGWWPSILVAEWGQLELMVNPYSDFTRGLTAVRAWYAMDTAMRYPAAFSYDATVA